MPEGPVYRPSRSAGMDPTTRRLATIAGGMGAALVVVVGGYTLIRGGHGGGAGAIPVIAPPPGPLKVRPVNPGGLQVLGAEPPPSTDGTATETLAPGPEKADPAALALALARARAAATPPPAPTPVPASRTATTAVPPTAGTATPPAPVLPATGVAPTAPAAMKPVSLPAPAPTGPATSSRITVQLGALDSEALAHQEWHRLAARGKALFDGRSLVVIPVQHDGRTLWRIRTGGFATTADANAFCVKARALGGACNVATF